MPSMAPPFINSLKSHTPGQQKTDLVWSALIPGFLCQQIQAILNPSSPSDKIFEFITSPPDGFYEFRLGRISLYFFTQFSDMNSYRIIITIKFAFPNLI